MNTKLRMDAEDFLSIIHMMKIISVTDFSLTRNVKLLQRDKTCLHVSRMLLVALFSNSVNTERTVKERDNIANAVDDGKNGFDIVGRRFQ